MTVRVLLADDQDLVRAGFRLILETEADIEVVGEARDGHEAVTEARRLRPDVTLMDVRMPRLDGIAATRRLAVDSPPVTRVLVLTTFDVDQHVFDALAAGASGFLLKNASPERLVDAIRVVAAGDALLAPDVTRRVIDEFARRPGSIEVPAEMARLTAREREVLGLVGRGGSNAEIAAELYLSEATVKTHLSRVLTKLGLRDRIHAVVYAHTHRLLG